MLPPGTQALPEDAVFTLEPPLESAKYKSPERVTGVLLGFFGPGSDPSHATHALIVNLDYKSEGQFTLRAPRPLETFDPAVDAWTRPATSGGKIELRLPGGGGKLVRMK
jgi:hypothetical protein